MKFTETESRMVITRGWEYCLISIEFQFGKMKSSGDGLHNSVNVLNAIELYMENG